MGKAPLPAPTGADVMLQVTNLEIGFSRGRGLRRSYQPFVQGLDLFVGAGEVHALIGASGAGKSLLAMALVGLLPPNATLKGRIEVDGQPHGPHMRGRQIALMPQGASYLDPRAKIGAQILWAAARQGVKVSLEESLAAFALPPIANSYPHQISGGEARRVLLLIATLARPKLLIADEPTVGLDPASRDLVLEALRAQRRQGVAVLLVSHDLHAVLPVADHVTLMGKGSCTESAAAFTGDGDALASPQARALWRALPENGMRL